MRSELRPLLRVYRPHDLTEAGYRDAMLALLDGGGDVFSRYHYEPGHFTASAFVLPPGGEALLLVHHRKIGLWLQPGGHIEPEDEGLAAAAAREATEESGVTGIEPAADGLFDVDVHTFPAHGDQPEHLHFDLRFLFQASTPDLRPGPEVAGARWYPFAEVVATSGDAALARPVQKLTT